MPKYLEELNTKDSEFYPELKDRKEINYNLFEMIESYLKNG